MRVPSSFWPAILVASLASRTVLAQDDHQGAGSESQGDGDTILVGQYGSFTGSEATFGQSGKNGIALAVREINAAGGVKGKQVRILQARKLGITQPFLGGDGWDSAQLGKIAGAAVEGSYFSTHYSQQDQSAAVQTFVRKYRDAYGEVPDVVGALGYDAAMVLFDAMKRSPSLSGRDIAKALAETRDFAGVTGVISIDAKRNARKPAVIMVMKDGQPTYFASIPPPP